MLIAASVFLLATIASVCCTVSCDDGAIDAEATLRAWLDDTVDADNVALDTFGTQLVPSDQGTIEECALYGDQLRAVADVTTAKRTIFEAVADIASGDRASVFIARNGHSVGLLVPFNGRCLATLATKCAELLGADAVDIALPMQLRSASGFAVRSDDDVWSIAHGLLYVLMDQETWVWPAFKVDFEWSVGNGRFRMRTVSDSPRVIYLTSLLAPEECSDLIELARPSLYASPTKDYSDDAAFKNFRTSQTAHVGDAGVGGTVRRRSWFVTRLPLLTCVESTQVVRYGTDKAWFKPHLDVYHNWPGWPDERNKASGPLDRWVQDLSIKHQTLQSGGGNPTAYVYRGVLPSMHDDFQLSVIELLLEAKPPELEPEWLDWVRSNYDRKATGLLVALISSKPNVFGVAQALWFAECASLAKAQGAAACPFDGDEARSESRRRPQKRVVPNRHVTVFHYLNDVESGGETVFPHGIMPPSFANEPPRPARPDMPECERGLSVQPKKGNSVIFYSRHGDMSTDPKSQHGGCPPISGEKWGANSFSWNVDSGYGYSQWGSM